MITDVRATAHYQAQLARMGMNDVVRRRPGWQFRRGGASAATPLVTATKPE
jgi:hypothetical protein